MTTIEERQDAELDRHRERAARANFLIRSAKALIARNQVRGALAEQTGELWGVAELRAAIDAWEAMNRR